MHPPSRIPNYLPALILLGIVLAGALWWWTRPSQERGPQVLAAGGKWELQQIHWTQYNGHWRVNVSSFLLRKFQKRLRSPDILKGLCGWILTNLPSAPDDVARQDVYRVTLERVAFIGRDKEKKYLWPGPIPVQVKNGACQAKGASGNYFLTYPGNLQNWELKDAKLSTTPKGQGAMKLRLFFINSTQDQTRLPLLDACAAFVADFGGIPALFGLDGLSGITEIEVLETKQTGPDILNFRRYIGVSFRYLNGTCLPLKQGEKT